jgi:hypothetical protein
MTSADANDRAQELLRRSEVELRLRRLDLARLVRTAAASSNRPASPF